MAHGIGDRFQHETKYHRDHLPGGGLDWDSKPDTYKEYPQHKRIDLPDPNVLAPHAPLHGVLTMRRSIRQFTGDPLSLGQLSYLLWAAAGIQRRERGY